MNVHKLPFSPCKRIVTALKKPVWLKLVCKHTQKVRSFGIDKLHKLILIINTQQARIITNGGFRLKNFLAVFLCVLETIFLTFCINSFQNIFPCRKNHNYSSGCNRNFSIQFEIIANILNTTKLYFTSTYIQNTHIWDHHLEDRKKI